jgi:hypothetical protein
MKISVKWQRSISAKIKMKNKPAASLAIMKKRINNVSASRGNESSMAHKRQTSRCLRCAPRQRIEK